MYIMANKVESDNELVGIAKANKLLQLATRRSMFLNQACMRRSWGARVHHEVRLVHYN
jgi:hypothetical protein